MMGLMAAVSGCASLSYPLPKCDGYAKRPLNRSMWEWEGGKVQGSDQHSSLSDRGAPAKAFAEPPVKTAAFAGFDEAGSHAACRAG